LRSLSFLDQPTMFKLTTIVHDEEAGFESDLGPELANLPKEPLDHPGWPRSSPPRPARREQGARLRRRSTLGRSSYAERPNRSPCPMPRSNARGNLTTRASSSRVLVCQERV